MELPKAGGSGSRSRVKQQQQQQWGGHQHKWGGGGQQQQQQQQQQAAAQQSPPPTTEEEQSEGGGARRSSKQKKQRLALKKSEKPVWHGITLVPAFHLNLSRFVSTVLSLEPHPTHPSDEVLYVELKNGRDETYKALPCGSRGRSNSRLTLRNGGYGLVVSRLYPGYISTGGYIPIYPDCCPVLSTKTSCE